MKALVYRGARDVASRKLTSRKLARNHGDRDPDQRSNRQASRRVALSKSWTDYSVAVNTPVYAARL